MGYTMKGSPMQRNFDIGNSPMKDEKKARTLKSDIKTKKKYRLMEGYKRNISTGEETTDYFKIPEGGKKIQISKSEYDRLKGN